MEEKLNSVECLKVVVVEDNPDTRSVIASMVRGLGHSVVDFENAEEALAYLVTQQVDVLVADVRLPGMSGEIFAVEARAIQPTLGIVFATGSGAFASDLDDGTTTVLLRKPFGVADFAQALASVTPLLKSSNGLTGR